MPTLIPCSVRRADLVTPFNAEAVFFPDGRPSSREALCAELSRLVYGKFESATADKQKILETLNRIEFTTTNFFSVSAGHFVDTQGFLTMSEDKSLSVLTFRGTEADKAADLGTDADIRLIPWSKGGKVHEGFAKALLAVWSQIEPFLQHSQGTLLFTGHSLGAALATLAASNHPPTVLYTFGSPLTGNEAFTRTLATVNVQRFVDCCDLVTRIPPSQLGYYHVGTLQYIDRHGTRMTNPSLDIIHADRRQARAEYLTQYGLHPGLVESRDMADHAPINYVSGITGRA